MTSFVQISANPDSNIPSVMYDQMQGARLATQHLIDLGHRQMAEISRLLLNYDGCDRHQGWITTLKNNGLDYSILFGTDDPQDIQDATLVLKADVISGKVFSFTGSVKNQNVDIVIVDGEKPEESVLQSMDYLVEAVVGTLPQ